MKAIFVLTKKETVASQDWKSKFLWAEHVWESLFTEAVAGQSSERRIPPSLVMNVKPRR